VKEKGTVDYGSFCTFVVEEGFKISSAERRMREIMAQPDSKIEATHKRSKRNTDYIAGYYWIGNEPVAPTYQLAMRDGIMVAIQQ
jgi:hypothetical protein